MITWAYVAGFFDGEGCVHYCPRNNCYRLRIAQAVREDSHVLQDIQDFLNAYNIHSTIGFRKSKNPKHRDTFDINIISSNNINRFLKGILTYTTVKKAQSLVAIEFTDGIIRNKKEAEEQRVAKTELAAKDYIRGHSLFEVSKRYGVALKTLRIRFIKKGIKIRTQREGIEMFWYEFGR